MRNLRLAIDGGTPVRQKPFPPALHGAQEIGEEEIDAVTTVLRRKKLFRYLLTDETSYTNRLEKAYKTLAGKRHALAVTGGTTALITALVGMGVSTGDEVIIPGYTYIATAAAVLSVGAIPVIAEVDDTLTLDPEDLEEKITPLSKAVIPVHMRGLPSQMDEIMAIAEKHNLAVIEDVAQANGGRYRERPLGGIGHAGTFSFQYYKIITSGEGGMVVTDDDEAFQRMAFRHDAAMTFWRPGWSIRPFAGENARICEMRAAIGWVQFRRLPQILRRTRSLKQQIAEAIRELPGITLQRVADPEGDCGIALSIYLPSAEEAKRFAAAAQAEGLPVDTVYNDGIPKRHIYSNWDYVLNKWTADRTGYPWVKPYYHGEVEYSQDMCPKTLDYLSRVVTIPLNQRMTDQDAEDVVACISKVAKAYYG